MPFQKPWRPYNSGDLLYGLADPRGELAVWLGADDLHTIDQYEIASIDRGNAGIVFDPDFVNALKGHPKTQIIVQLADKWADLTNDAHWLQAPPLMLGIAKRKCKGGLNWIIHNTFRHIHFCLAELDLVAAATKSYDGSSGGTADSPQGKADPAAIAWYRKERSITGSELRWVYRNRNDGFVQDQVQFWRKRVSWDVISGTRTNTTEWYQCQPPWADPGYPKVRSAWAAYQPTKEWPDI